MRLFIAIQFTDNILDSLMNFQNELKSQGMRGRYAPRENLHLTLAFIGEYADSDAVMDALLSVPFHPISLRLDGIGNFGDLYWVGVAGNPALAGYVKRLRHSLADRNIPYDRKRFSPHITIIRKGIFHGSLPFPQVHMPNGEMEARYISLMRSDRGKNGMIYTEIGRSDSPH